MTDLLTPSKKVARRRRAERRFRCYGMLALLLAFLALVGLLASIIGNGASGFLRTEIKLDVALDAAEIDPLGTRDAAVLAQANYTKLVHAAVRVMFPEVTEKRELRKLYSLLSIGAGERVRDHVTQNPGEIGKTISLWLDASSTADLVHKNKVDASVPESERKVTDNEIGWLKQLQDTGRTRLRFNDDFIFGGDSREPERAGFGASIVGSLLTLLVTLLIAFPLGVLSAVYLEEFAKQNRWTDVIEVNINNLAAVPSIVFGLLGLSVYLNYFDLPRSAPLVGGLTLSLMILPVIIITTRVALKAVPPSVRAAALGLGASPLQVVLHHVLPLALPGIMTGTILGLARALGETAPLLMIGMVAFIADVPHDALDPATAMPVQIYLWASSPEAGFAEKTSAGILLLLAILMMMNSVAIFIRRKFEVRW